MLKFTDRLVLSSYSMGRASRSMVRALAVSSARRDCSFFEIVPIRAASYLTAAMCVMAPHIRLLSWLMPKILTVTRAPLGGLPRFG